jgi:hypothetical protein
MRRSSRTCGNRQLAEQGPYSLFDLIAHGPDLIEVQDVGPAPVQDTFGARGKTMSWAPPVLGDVRAAHPRPCVNRIGLYSAAVVAGEAAKVAILPRVETRGLEPLTPALQSRSALAAAGRKPAGRTLPMIAGRDSSALRTIDVPVAATPSRSNSWQRVESSPGLLPNSRVRRPMGLPGPRSLPGCP